MHAGLVASTEAAPDSGSVPAVQELTVRINDQPAGSTTEPWSMGSPAAALRWLSTSLDEVGTRLLRGQVVLTGSVLPLFPIRPGARVIAEARPLGRCAVEIDP
jgi:2-oxopent-4-enoate/cis-2-oxohex-4-enoate hydratase